MPFNSIQNPINRLTELTQNDLDYLDLETEFQNIIELAKNITGLEVSILNLIDAHHIWPVTQKGIQIEAMPLEDTPCQYTILKDDYFEVKDLTSHDTLKEKDYVKNAPFYKYYLGVPLKTIKGVNIGSICFFDTQAKTLNDNQVKLLQIVAKEAVSKIDALKVRNDLRKEFFEYRANQRKIANDIRNPLSGIIGLSDVLIEQFEDIEKDEAKEYNLLINKSAKSILTSLEDVIINQKRKETETNTLNLKTLKDRLIELYSPLLVANQIELTVTFNDLKANILFLKNNVNYLVGNLLTEALLNIAKNGTLTIALDLIIKVDQLYIKAEYSSEKLTNTQNLVENEVLKVYENKVVELGGALILNQTENQLFELTLPLKSI